MFTYLFFYLINTYHIFYPLKSPFDIIVIKKQNWLEKRFNIYTLNLSKLKTIYDYNFSLLLLKKKYTFFLLFLIVH